MKKKLTANIPLKLFSVFLGFLVWLIVANIDNPVISRSFVVSSIELVNEAYINDTGLVCLRDGTQNTVRVTVTGQSSSVKKLTVDDVHVTADLQQAVSLATDPVMIPLTASVTGFGASSISVYPQNLSVTLEDKVTSEFMISVVNSGDSKPGRGYEIGAQTASPEKVRITGPKSLIQKIDKVTASVNVNGITSDTTEDASLTVIDKNADILTETALSNLRFDTTRVKVTTKLWKVRTDVGLDVSFTGVPAEGYVAENVTTVPATVSVAGTTDALEALREDNNILYISDQPVDISGADSDVEGKVTLSVSLPEGLKLTSGSSDEVLVTVSILPDGGKAYTIPTSHIEVLNLPKGMQVAFEIDKLEMRVQTDLEENDMDVDKVKASIDISEAEKGTSVVPVSITLPEGYQLINEVTTEITVSEVSKTEESGED